MFKDVDAYDWNFAEIRKNETAEKKFVLTCSASSRRKKCRDLRNKGISGKIPLKYVIGKQIVRVQYILNWLRMGSDFGDFLQSL
jgi:hypothetical protein